jgi:hypothetical protein
LLKSQVPLVHPYRSCIVRGFHERYYSHLIYLTTVTVTAITTRMITRRVLFIYRTNNLIHWLIGLIHLSKRRVVLTGPSGSGKSYTLMAFIYYILLKPDCDLLPVLLTTKMVQESAKYQQLVINYLKIHHKIPGMLLVLSH